MSLRAYTDHVDDYNRTHTIEIHKQGYNDSVDYLKNTGSGYASFDYEKIDPKNPTDNPIQKGALEFSLWLQSETLINEIKTADEQTFWAVHKVDGTQEWIGYIYNDLSTYEEGFDNHPFRITLMAKDFTDLGSKDYVISTDPVVLPDSRERVIATIAHLLDTVGFSMPIKTHTSWIEENLTGDYDYLDKIYHETKALRDFGRTGDESDQPITVEEALNKLCVNHGLLLKQADGSYWIDQFTEYEDPLNVQEATYDLTGTQSSLTTGNDLTVDANTSDLKVTIQQDNRDNSGLPGLKRVKNKYDHRTEVSGIQIPETFSGSYSQVFLSDGDQKIEYSAFVSGDFFDGTTSSSGGVKIEVTGYWWDESRRDWIDSSTESPEFNVFDITIKDDSLATPYGMGGIASTTNSTPPDADGTLTVTLRSNIPGADGATYKAAVSIVNPIAQEDSESINYQLTQNDDYSVVSELEDTWFGDGPLAYSVGALRYDSNLGDTTTDTWQRKGSTAYRNFHHNLLAEHLDVRRGWRRLLSATLKGLYYPWQILSYDSEYFYFLGGSWDLFTGNWEGELFSLDIQTANDDTFDDIPKFTDESGSGSGTTSTSSSSGLDQSTADARYFEESKNLSEGDAATIISNLGITATASELNRLDGDLATVQSNLGLTIGSDVQAWDAQLDTLSTLTSTQAGYLTSLDQGVSTTDSATFASLDIDSLNFNNDTISSSGNIVLDAVGDVLINGDTIKVDKEMTTTDNVIVLNDGETGAGITAGEAGLQFDRGTETDYEILFQESNGLFSIGEVGNLQAVATRPDSPDNNGIAIWDSTNNWYETDAGLTFDGSVLSVPSIDTGQGANELYPMNQGVRTTDSPTWDGATFTDGVNLLPSSGGNNDFRLSGINNTDGNFYNPFIGYGGLGIFSNSGTNRQGFIFSDASGSDRTFTTLVSTDGGSNWEVAFDIRQNKSVNVGGTLDISDTLTGVDADFSGSLDADTLRTDSGKFLAPTSYQFRNAGDTGFRDVEMAGLTATTGTYTSLLTAQGGIDVTGGLLDARNGAIIDENHSYSINDLTDSSNGTTLATDWNNGAHQLKLTSNNNSLAIIVGNDGNERKAILQVGHGSPNYAYIGGEYYINPFGGNVGINQKSASEALDVNGNILSNGNVFSNDFDNTTWAGNGYRGTNAGDWVVENLRVRNALEVYEFVAKQISSVGGKEILSIANGRIEEVEPNSKTNVISVQDVRDQAITSFKKGDLWIVQIVDVNNDKESGGSGGVVRSITGSVVNDPSTDGTLAGNEIEISIDTGTLSDLEENDLIVAYGSSGETYSSERNAIMYRNVDRSDDNLITRVQTGVTDFSGLTSINNTKFAYGDVVDYWNNSTGESKSEVFGSFAGDINGAHILATDQDVLLKGVNLDVQSLPNIDDLNLQRLWRFDDNNTTTAIDATGNDDLSLSNVTSTNGKSNRAAVLNGTSAYASANSSVSPETISLWIRPTNSFTGDDSPEVVLSSANQNILIRLGDFTGGYSGETIAFAQLGVDNSYDLYDPTLSSGQWYHLVFTFTGTNWEFYLDGEFLSPVSSSNGGSSSKAPITPIFGRRESSSDLYYTGYVDEVRFYERQLSHNEIKSLYANPSGTSGGLISANTVQTGKLESTNQNLIFDLDTGELTAQDLLINAGGTGFESADFHLDTINNKRMSLGSVFSADGGADEGQLAGSYFDATDLFGFSGTPPADPYANKDQASVRLDFANGRLFYEAMGRTLYRISNTAGFDIGNEADSIYDDSYKTSALTTGAGSSTSPQELKLQTYYRKRFGERFIILSGELEANMSSGDTGYTRVYLSAGGNVSYFEVTTSGYTAFELKIPLTTDAANETNPAGDGVLQSSSNISNGSLNQVDVRLQSNIQTSDPSGGNNNSELRENIILETSTQ